MIFIRLNLLEIQNFENNGKDGRRTNQSNGWEISNVGSGGVYKSIFTPKFKNIFNAFKECPYDDLKVVIVG